jgi:glycyl-tRNA synthetase beta chain
MPHPPQGLRVDDGRHILQAAPMPDLLLEIGTEELPARFLAPAIAHLDEAAKAILAELRLTHGVVDAQATPRRLVLSVRDVASRQADHEEEVYGPRADVAWDQNGALTKAGQGFLKGKGLDEKDAYKAETKKGVVIAARVRETGVDAEQVLPARLQHLVSTMPFAKSMRWTDGKETFGRPVRWLLALFGTETLSFSFAGVTSGNTTRGHRFHAPDPVVVSSIESHAKALEQGRVVLSSDERKREIREAARKLALTVGGRLREDEALLDVVANLVEKPWPILGRFDASFLDIPKEILISEMREHQKYFAIENDTGGLLPAFVVVAGSEPANPDFVAAGHARVLRSRFEDGAFYFRQDAKVPLSERAAMLERMMFQRELGTLADKTARIVALTRELAKQIGAPDDVTAHALRAAQLCKADLASGVVGEFPELQGTMGRYYALQAGEPDGVARAIEEHYSPRHAGAALPSTDAGALVAIADRIDTIVGILGIGKAPTGSADPFGLRRAAIAVLHVAMARSYRFDLGKLLERAIEQLGPRAVVNGKPVPAQEQYLGAHTFFLTRMKGVLSDRLAEHGHDDAGDVVDACIAANTSDLTTLLARALALAELRARDAIAFQALAATFKRVSNIVLKAPDAERAAASQFGDANALKEPAEVRLLDEVKRAEAVVAALDPHAYDRLLGLLVELKPAVDKFFDDVMVMVDDQALRQARLSLLMRIRGMLSGLADFTRIQGE